MELQEALRVIGLNEKQSAVYVALLQLGKASAYSIAGKSGLKKPTTYVILEELMQRGLAQRVPRLRKQHYVAQSPEEAFALADEKLSLAKQKLPELLALTKGETTKVSALYFEGIAGVKQAMEYGLKESKGEELVGFYALSEDLPKELTTYFDEWNQKRHALGIKMLGIAPEHPSLTDYRKTDAQFRREFKTVPCDQYSSQVAVDVVGSCVRIHDYKNLQGVVIENADVAKTVREIFSMLWSRI